METATIQANGPTSGQPFNWIEHSHRQAERYNAELGTPNADGSYCPECGNKHWVHVVAEGGEIIAKRCSCHVKHEAAMRLEKSGAAELIKRCKFDNFTTDTDWQLDMRNKGRNFASDPDESWFFAGGQTGAGKTHICTAAFAELMEGGQRGLYVMWRGESRFLIGSGYSKAKETAERLDELCSVPLLYIDDLLKSDTEGGARPERREMELAFEIINVRYNKNLATIISSEFTLAELAGISQAIAGRIAEKCGGHIVNIAPQAGRNYRLAGL